MEIIWNRVHMRYHWQATSTGRDARWGNDPKHGVDGTDNCGRCAGHSCHSADHCGLCSGNLWERHGGHGCHCLHDAGCDRRWGHDPDHGDNCTFQCRLSLWTLHKLYLSRR